LLLSAFAFGQVRTSRVTVQVHPEMQLAPAASDVQVTVRLASAVQAQVWRADTCDAAPARAFPVTKSGRVQIPLATLGAGSKVCATSTDGALKQSLDLDASN
jgi:hypothetical protein